MLPSPLWYILWDSILVEEFFQRLAYSTPRTKDIVNTRRKVGSRFFLSWVSKWEFMTVDTSVASCEPKSEDCPSSTWNSALRNYLYGYLPWSSRKLKYCIFNCFPHSLETSSETDCGRYILCVCKSLQIDFARVFLIDDVIIIITLKLVILLSVWG